MITRVKLNAILDAVLTLRNNIPDEEAIKVQVLYPSWKPEVEYVAGERVMYEEVLYKVLMDHTSQETWTPVDAPSLFAKVLIPDENVIPEWEQPNSTNPYMTGDAVTYHGITYVSIVDNNVWEPGVYGWEITE